MNPLLSFWAPWVFGPWLAWSMSWHIWAATFGAGGMVDKWHELRRVPCLLRQAAKIIDNACEAEPVLDKKSVSDVLRAMADGFDELKPEVEPDEPEGGVVLSIETGERLN